MGTAFQKGQKVLTPEGGGLIEEIIGDEVRVRLNSDSVKTFAAEELEDDSDQG